MHRIDGAGAAPGNLFTEGDPVGGTPATVVTAAIMNALQEEVVGVIEAAGIALSKPNNAQLLAAINKLMGAVVPSGAVMPFMRSAAPAGWLKCNGAAVSRATYSALFAVIGVTFGAGNGSTTFNLPDLRGEFLRGLDDGRGVDAARTLGSAQEQQTAAHKHVMPWGESNTGVPGGPPFGRTGSAGRLGTEGTDGDNYWFHTNDGSNYDGTVNAAGVIGAETRPRNIATVYCIKT